MENLITGRRARGQAAGSRQRRLVQELAEAQDQSR